MATQTTRLQLTKPDYDETADIAVINENMNRIDSAIADIQDTVSTHGSQITALNTSVSTIQGSYVTKVKGNAETTYRTGQVNLTPANIGAAAASHSHSYLPLAGGTLTGQLKGTSAVMSGNVSTGQRITLGNGTTAEIYATTPSRTGSVLIAGGGLKSAGDENGTAVRLGAGGLTLVGGGEYAYTRYDLADLADSTEALYLGADGNVYIETNGNTIASRKTFTFGTGGTFNSPSTITQNGTAVSLSGHKHAAGDINSGTLALARGGTGASLSAAPSIITDLASTSGASPFAAKPRPGITGILPQAHGGTGAATVSANRVLAGPGSGSAAAPTWRTLGVPDLPSSFVTTVNNLGNNVNAIGKVLSKVGTSQTVASDSIFHSLASLNIGAGVYIIIVGFYCAGNATGYRDFTFSKTSVQGQVDNDRLASRCFNPGGSHPVYDHIVLPIDVSSTTTYYVWARQNSGSDLTMSASIRAVQIKS